MPKTASASKKAKSDDQLLDQGISQLLQAVKQHVASKGGQLVEPDRGLTPEKAGGRRAVAGGVKGKRMPLCAACLS